MMEDKASISQLFFPLTSPSLWRQTVLSDILRSSSSPLNQVPAFIFAPLLHVEGISSNRMPPSGLVTLHCHRAKAFASACQAASHVKPPRHSWALRERDEPFLPNARLCRLMLKGATGLLYAQLARN